VNIDTLDKEYNKFLSKIDYLFAFESLEKLVDLRKKYQSNFKIHVLTLTLKKYLDICKKRTGDYPLRLKNNSQFNPKLIKDDYRKVKRKIKPLLSKGDSINRSFIYLWAEYQNIKTPRLNYNCPMLNAFDENIFINPDGKLYLCCYDSNYNLSYGNIKEKSIGELIFSQKRKELIELLKNREYLKIGFPCQYVQLCQREKPTLRAKIISRMKRYSWGKFVVNKLKREI